uniref:Uncharacterized protein n=1 Tax=Psilocybe cubensis TaxID=181762 RepID=A0A8H8CII8_PSICU
MGVGLSILIGVGIYEAIQHRHEIKQRCTRHPHDNSAHQFDQNPQRDEFGVTSEKNKDFPDIKPLARNVKQTKKRKSLIPRFRSKPGKGTASEAVVNPVVQIDRGSTTESRRCEDHYADEELPLAPPPPYASLLTEEVFPGS